MLLVCFHQQLCYLSPASIISLVPNPFHSTAPSSPNRQWAASLASAGDEKDKKGFEQTWYNLPYVHAGTAELSPSHF